MFTRKLITYTIACLTLLMSSQASAHLGSMRFGEFYAGMLHPLTSLVHLIPWIALALLAAIQGIAQARRNLAAFPAAVAIGVQLGAVLGEASFLYSFNLVSFVLLGALLALAKPLPDMWFLTLTALCGLSHGMANAVNEFTFFGQLLYTAGVASVAYLLVALLGAGAVALGQHNWGQIAVRAVGSWIFASGIIYSGFTLFGVQGV